MEDKYNIIVTQMEETVSKKVGFENKEIINEKITIIEKQETFENESHQDSYQIINSKNIVSEKGEFYEGLYQTTDSYLMPTQKMPNIAPRKKQSSMLNNSRVETSKMENNDFEINRLNQKCKAYQYEVERLNAIHEEETSKQRLRVKLLETGVKKLDTLSSQCFYMLTDLYDQSCKAIENIAHCRKMTFVKPNQSKSVHDLKNWLNEQSIKHFVKQRRIFINTEDVIDSLSSYSQNDLQNKFDENLYVLEKTVYEQGLNKSPKNRQTFELNQKITLEDHTSGHDKSQISKLFQKNDMGSLLREFSYQFSIGNDFTGLVEILNDTLLKLSIQNCDIDFQSSYQEIEKLLENILKFVEKRDGNNEYLNAILEKKKKLKLILVDYSDVQVKKETLLKEVEELEHLKERAFQINQENEYAVENLKGKKVAINNLLSNDESTSYLDLQVKKSQVDQDFQQEKSKKNNLTDISEKLKYEQSILKESTESYSSNNRLLEKVVGETKKDLEYWRQQFKQAEHKKIELNKQKESYIRELDELKIDNEEQNEAVSNFSVSIIKQESEVKALRGEFK